MSDKPAPGSIKTFSCPNCGGMINIRAVGISITAVCASCGSIVDVANENVALILKAAVKTRLIAIPLGSRGTFYGIVWEVIGYSERRDGPGDFYWREYLLFNPYQGFRFLTEADGHWSFVTMLRDDVATMARVSSIDYANEHYRLFVRGTAYVTYVMGEFYWRVKVDDKAQVADYVAPPLMLSMENSGGDVVWSRSDYLERSVVADAFKKPLRELPRQSGVAANQPSPYSKRLNKCKIPATIAFCVLMALQIVFVSNCRNEVIYERTMHVDASQRNQTVIADAIDVPGENGNLEFIAQSPVNNGWVDLSMSLVDDKTQETEEFSDEVSYYYGSDSDGAWSEGAQHHAVLLSAIPGGKYHLMVEPDSVFTQNGLDFSVHVVRDVPTWGLFLAALSFILIYPAYLLLRHWSFEKRRWAESDYTGTTLFHES